MDTKESINEDLAKLWDLETIGIRPIDEVSEGFHDDIIFNGKR